MDRISKKMVWLLLSLSAVLWHFSAPHIWPYATVSLRETLNSIADTGTALLLCHWWAK